MILRDNYASCIILSSKMPCPYMCTHCISKDESSGSRSPPESSLAIEGEEGREEVDVRIGGDLLFDLGIGREKDTA